MSPWLGKRFTDHEKGVINQKGDKDVLEWEFFIKLLLIESFPNTAGRNETENG